MSDLTLEQTDRIAQFVKRNEIVFSHLCDDLIDHICCDIEDTLKNGSDFEYAFSSIRKTIGEKGLREIQEDTLFAVDSKYRKMKRTMKISGVIGTIMLGLASVFKINHWPLAGILLFLGGLVIIFIFLPSSLNVLWKESKSSKRLFLFISTFLASALFMAGIMFKIQHWPAAGAIMSLGMLSAVFLVVPALIRRMINDPENKIPGWIIYTGAITISVYGVAFIMKLLHWPFAGILLFISTLILCLLVIPAYFIKRWGKDDFVSIRAVMVLAAILVFLVPGAIVNLSFTRNFEAMFMESFRMNNSSLEFRMSRNDKLISECSGLGIEGIDLLHMKTGELIGSIDEMEDILLVPAAPSLAELNSSTSNLKTSSFYYEGVNELFNENKPLITGMETRLGSYKNLLKEMTDDSFDQEVLAPLDLNQYLPVRTIESEGGPQIAPSVLVQALQMLKGSVLDAEAAALRMLRQNNTNPIK